VAALALALLCAPRLALAEPGPRRRGLDLEAHYGMVGCAASCDRMDFGQTVGGALLYRALPHLAAGVAADALFMPFARTSEFPTLTGISGLAGPTLRGYTRGSGHFDAYVGLTVGPTFFRESPPAGGTSTLPLVGIDQILGAEVHLTDRLRLTSSLAVTMLFIQADSGLVLERGSPDFGGIPWLSVSLRVGFAFAMVQ
jgi:hypothetical protein